MKVTPGPENYSLRAITEFIENYFDVAGTLKSTDDAWETLVLIDDLSRLDCGLPTTLTEDDVQLYLNSL